ncbi:MAG TPA: ABC transporter permease [Bauldia sp.]|nr:ABC transporter permease [Bauldia sp.]
MLRRPETTLLAVLLVLAVLIGIDNDLFWSPQNLTDIARSASFTFVVGVGTTFVLISGGLDLSVGSVYGFGGIVTGLALLAGWPTALSILAGVAAGAFIGLVNGAIVTQAKVPSVIVTLGMLFIVRGLVLVFSGGAPVYPLPDGFVSLGRGEILAVPTPIWVAAVVGVLGQLALSKTVFGRRVYHVGGNETAAYIAGVPVNRTRIIVFVLSGLTAAVGGILVAARIASAQPSSGTGLELQVIASVIIGGTSLFGGAGSVFGTLIGTLLIAVLNNGMIMMHIDPFYQSIVVGVIIVLAVAIDGWRRRRLGLA